MKQLTRADYNGYKESLKEIERIHQSGKRPTLCMHVCCAVCSCWPLEFLKDFDVTIYYTNSNIYPSEEYWRRLNELKQFLKEVHPEVKLVEAKYDNEAYTQKISVLKDEPEKGKRCIMCYGLRMNEAYRYANEHHFDYFTTVMTVSRQKDSKVLNHIGLQLSHQYPNTKYFISDFKKADGNIKTNRIASSLGMYRQDYCGCIYSYLQRHSTDQGLTPTGGDPVNDATR
ncbi:MAG: epoxyqueuosine reductase QueH [Erysipelotrichaceae bacterium]|nr:epoxyqueuosine reductase QueH [Erysipelotrichaceae bacterium]